MNRVRSIIGRLRWIHLAPVLAFLALSAWAFASPVGAAPDDDYHLISIWCSSGGSDQCQEGSENSNRRVVETLLDVVCFAQDGDKSASCQEAAWRDLDSFVETERGNFVGEYPPVYYATMHLFAGADIQTSALVIRLVNAALFVGLATTLAALLPVSRRRTLLWGWLVTLVPLGMFLIPSNNPSAWAITGVGTAFLALLGWFESEGRRRWALGALYLVGVLMAAAARGDAAIYVVGATVTVLILTAVRERRWAMLAILPAVGLMLSLILFSTSGQAGVGTTGFGGGGSPSLPGDEAGVDQPLAGFALAANNLLMLPFLWTGVWGTWGLGWFDTTLPAIVPWSATAAFIVVVFAGLGLINWRKAIAASGVLFVLIALPTYVLTIGGDRVGEMLQPRYLLPLIVLFAFVMLFEPGNRAIRFTRLQTFAILGALALANFVSLQINLRRYVTGADEQGLNLDSGIEWWWTGFPVGPSAVWVIGTLAYVGLLAVLWPQLRRAQPVT